MEKKIKVVTTDYQNNLFLDESETYLFHEDNPGPDGNEGNNFIVYPEVTYQKIKGFGGALTESTALNYSILSDENKKKFIDLYFDSEKGIGYSTCRLTINSSDFSKASYSYDDTKEDFSLKDFSMAHEEQWLFPLLHDVLEKNKDVDFLSSPWSPPSWMKTNERMDKGGKLRKDCYQVWADFFVKYLLTLKEKNIPVFAVTIQNEAKAEQGWESCFYTAEEEKDFAVNYLRPALQKANLDTKVFFWDHNKERVVSRALTCLSDKEGNDTFSGIAVHWYSGDHFDALSVFHKLFPDQMILGTEHSTGAHKEKLYLSGEQYAHDIIGDLNHYANGWMDWNMLLTEDGGPYHWGDEQIEFRKKYEEGIVTDDNMTDIEKKFLRKTLKHGPWTGEAPVTVDEKGNLLCKSSYYYMGHISKYIKRDAVRLGHSLYSNLLEGTAFLNKDGSIVMVLMNASENDLPVILRNGNLITDQFTINAHSIKTFILPSTISSN